MLANTPSNSWWASALGSNTTILCAALAAVVLVLLIFLLCAWVGVHRRDKPHDQVRRQAGTATIEFALVFPIILMLALLLSQVTLLMVGNFFVHYAAFAATRSAITYIPADATSAGGGKPNVIIPSIKYPKFAKIHEAAVYALVPVSGRLQEADIPTDDFVSGLRDYFSYYGRPQPPWIDSLAADRLRYADTNTDITLMRTHINDKTVVTFSAISKTAKLGPRDPVTVRVEHRLNLAVPYVRALFADGEYETADGWGAYRLVKAQYTLTNEGIDPELPPEPTLPRWPK
jgi:hypothetical protein